MTHRLPVVCPSCGTPHDRTTTCPNCKPTNTRDTAAEDTLRGNARARGYNTAWDRLSRRARTLQPWCTDCGTTHDLTVDHSPAAWDRQAAGQPIRLDDVDVVCRPCNGRRGAARGPNARPRPTVSSHRQALQSLTDTPNPGGEGPNDPHADRGGKAKSQ